MFYKEEKTCSKTAITVNFDKEITNSGTLNLSQNRAGASYSI